MANAIPVRLAPSGRPEEFQSGDTVAPVFLPASATLFPGTVVWGACVNTPAGWLLCDGAAASRSTYADLFAATVIQQSGNTTNGNASLPGLSDTSVIKPGWFVSGPGIQAATLVTSITNGTTVLLSKTATATASGVAIVFSPWGIGDGSTTFNVPDLLGRVPVGAGSGSGLTARTLGEKTGAETVALTTPNLPSHTHPINSGTNLQPPGNTGGGGADGYTTGSRVLYNLAATGASGSGTSHANMQPFLGLSAFVKT